MQYTLLCDCCRHARGSWRSAVAQRAGGQLRTFVNMRVSEMDAERLSTLLASLPALSSLSRLILPVCNGAALATTQAFMIGAARAIGRCPCLQHLDLRIQLADRLADQFSRGVWAAAG